MMRKPDAPKHCPVTFAASSLARKTTIGATLAGSRGVPSTFSDCGIPVAPGILPAGIVSVMRVAAPGMIAFTVIPYLCSEFALEYVRPRIPALAAAQLGWAGLAGAHFD